jgi:hypothetical protein
VSSSVVEPGTRLGRRFRLEAPLDDLNAPNGTRWRGVDEVLNRPVGVRTLPADSPHAAAALAAAQRAAHLTDPRFLRILDADRVDGTVYVVSEWVPGESLAVLLRGGPLATREAHRLAAEIATGVAAAHEAGLAHERLAPQRVLRSDDGQVKVVGLELDAAVTGGRSPDPAAADTRGCGALLYAALTARWPLGTTTELAPAPYADGHLCAPRQVRAGIPPNLDELACRSLGEPLRRGWQPLQKPAELAAALSGASHQVPAPSGSGWRSDAPSQRWEAAARDDDWVSSVLTADGEGEPALSTAAAKAGTPTRLARTIAVTVLAAGLGLAAWQTALTAFEGSDQPSGTPSPSAAAAGQTSPAAAPSGTLIRVRSAVDFDPEGNGEENHSQTGRAIDGKQDTAWHTATYYDSADLNGTKSGVGLLLDLGSPQPVATVTLDLVGRGTDLQLRTATRVGRGPDDYRLAAEVEGAGSLVTLNLDPKSPARYVLVWLTSLPTETDGRYRGGITEVTLRR